MAQRSEENAARSRPVLLAGAGSRPTELAAVLATLAGLRADGAESAPASHRPHGLEDLEELLSMRPAEGTLILDCERVPAEDIGFVRRFLERRPEWRLVVLGDEASDRRARGLLALPRARWLAWPPDLEQIAALLGAAPAGGALPESPVEHARAPRMEREGTSTARVEPAEVDVGALLQELLAAAALGEEGGPRTLFRCDRPIVLRRARSTLAPGLTDLLALARRCAGKEGVVSAQVDPTAADSGDARIRFEFPRGELPEVDLGTLLDRGSGGSSVLASEIEAARRGAALLRAQGCKIKLEPRRPDRVRLELEIAGEPSARAAAEPAARPRKAEDPFA
jgi:hypothetical protein